MIFRRLQFLEGLLFQTVFCLKGYNMFLKYAGCPMFPVLRFLKNQILFL